MIVNYYAVVFLVRQGSFGLWRTETNHFIEISPPYHVSGVLQQRVLESTCLLRLFVQHIALKGQKQDIHRYVCVYVCCEVRFWTHFRHLDREVLDQFDGEVLDQDDF